MVRVRTQDLWSETPSLRSSMVPAKVVGSDTFAPRTRRDLKLTSGPPGPGSPDVVDLLLYEGLGDHTRLEPTSGLSTSHPSPSS